MPENTTATPTPDFTTAFAKAIKPIQATVTIAGVAVAILAIFYIVHASPQMLGDDRIAAAAQTVQQSITAVDTSERSLAGGGDEQNTAYDAADQALTKAIGDLGDTAAYSHKWDAPMAQVQAAASAWSAERAQAVKATQPGAPGIANRDQLIQAVSNLSIGALSDDATRSDRFIDLIVCVSVVALAVLIWGSQQLGKSGDDLAAVFQKGVMRQEQMDALRRHRALLLTMLRSMGDGMIAVDKTDRITFVNPVAEKLMGLMESDAIGRDAAKTVTVRNEKTGEKIVLPFDKTIGECLDHELPAYSVVVAQDGTQRPVSGQCVPVWDEKENVIGATLIFRDVSEKQAARKALQASSAYREAIMDTALDAVVVLDATGRIVEYNPAAEGTFGYPKREAVGRLAADVIAAPKSAAARYFNVGDAAALGKRVEFTAARRDGAQFPVEMSITPVPGVEPPMYVAYIRDITDQRNAEQTLRDAKDAAEAESAAKSVFLNDMSDELRTPLNAVIGYTEILQEEASSRKLDTFTPDLRKIHNAGRLLLTLVNDVLDLSKIESGKMELYLDDIEIAPLVAEIAAAVQPLIDNNENTLTINCPADIGMMHADRIKVRQSVLYLISNAARFAQKRQLSLDVTREKGKTGEQVTFRIADNSPGLASEQTEQLAEAMASGDDATRTYRFGGHGLGIVIARQLTEMMGGEMEVTRVVGHSPTFFVHVPAKVHAAAK